MPATRILGAVIALIGAVQALSPVERDGQLCSATLIIDDFANWDTAENSLKGATSGKLQDFS